MVVEGRGGGGASEEEESQWGRKAGAGVAPVRRKTGRTAPNQVTHCTISWSFSFVVTTMKRFARKFFSSKAMRVCRDTPAYHQVLCEINLLSFLLVPCRCLGAAP